MDIAGVSLLALHDRPHNKYPRKDIINKEGDRDRACLRAHTLGEGALGAQQPGELGGPAFLEVGGEGQC